MARLNGHVAVVTGSAQGIGAELATGLACEGAAVVVADVADGAATVSAIENAGGRAIYVATDVTDNGSLDEMVRQAEEAFGPLSVLVNNAGIFATLGLKDFWDIDNDEWDRVMRVNVRGVFQTTKAALPSLRRRGDGSIINIGSGTMLRGAPFFMHYVTSKGAVLAMTRSIARELGSLNIRANCVLPSFTLSAGVKSNEQMISRFKDAAVASRMLRRDMVPADIVGAVTFLASDESNFITGQAFNIDGGAVTY
jgi:NAD(P)-dependent dehydrogenase (short-subunit alcohol dehydrogenase family)